jgi:hypothetical protein
MTRFRGVTPSEPDSRSFRILRQPLDIPIVLVSPKSIRPPVSALTSKINGKEARAP